VDTVLVARSDGVLAGDVRPLVRMNIQVIVEQNGRRESGFAGFGGRYSTTRTCWPTTSRRRSPARRCARRW
jgi:predicted Zn-dependent protease